MKIQVPDVNELNDKLLTQLSKYGWYNHYKHFDLRPAIENLGTKFSPKFKSIMEFFSTCKPQDLRLVVIESNAVPPYPVPGYRLPYEDCNLKIQESCGITIDYSLWNGLLVIPATLTNERGRTEYHRKLWEPFIAHTIDEINRLPDIKWILSGKHVWGWEDYINPHHEIFKHYSPVTRKRPYNGAMFRMINSIATIPGINSRDDTFL